MVYSTRRLHAIDTCSYKSLIIKYTNSIQVLPLPLRTTHRAQCRGAIVHYCAMLRHHSTYFGYYRVLQDYDMP